MTHCVLTNTKEFKELYSQVFPGLEFKNPEIASLAADVAIWQSENGLDKYPTAKDMLRTSSEIFNQEIGEQRLKQVENLFDSNPELANAVYSKILTNSGLSAENLLSLLLKDNLIEKQCS